MTSIAANTIIVRLDTFVIPYWGRGSHLSHQSKGYYLNLRKDKENQVLEVTNQKQNLTEISHKLNAVFCHKTSFCERYYEPGKNAHHCWRFEADQRGSVTDATMKNFETKMRLLNHKIVAMRSSWGWLVRDCRELSGRLPVPFDARYVTLSFHTSPKAFVQLYNLQLFAKEDVQEEDRQNATAFPICQNMMLGTFTPQYQSQCCGKEGMREIASKRMECAKTGVMMLVMTFLFPLMFAKELIDRREYWRHNWQECGGIRRCVIFLDLMLGFITSPLFMIAYGVKCLFAAVFNKPDLIYKMV